ncbi:hypothetical protein [Ciceribacter ferrooxidans]|uniref:Uncharacterized protein n=1 Tax=Ciceribacter ferrooxidans TaxID=2509717 RepID=A0A4Q2SVH6_9HYPH|nr:hypothetical protein [Ciceribacter ferrooxidans]RYC10055.1 hypothetical protein EUU22_18435 [Ciceribacter ferrooxidans]
MGWIEWTGGAMPVDGDTEVVIMTEAGRIVEGKASDFEWELSGSRHDIIGYRLQADDDRSEA